MILNETFPDLRVESKQFHDISSKNKQSRRWLVDSFQSNTGLCFQVKVCVLKP